MPKSGQPFAYKVLFLEVNLTVAGIMTIEDSKVGRYVRSVVDDNAKAVLSEVLVNALNDD